VNLEGLSGHKVEVELQGAFHAPRILVDGQPAAKGSKRGQYMLPGTDGHESAVELKTSFLDPVPHVLWAGKKITLADALKWYQWIWCAFPVLLLFVGGAIGGALGGLGVTLNVRIMRSDMSGVLRYAITALISVAALGIYLVVAVLFLSAIHKQ
jgi:hypothetical protein